MKLKILIIILIMTTPLLSKEVKLENAYIKYTSSSNSVVYLTLNNTSNTEKKLIETKSNIADRVELFTMKPSDSGTKMIPVSEIPIPKKSLSSISLRKGIISCFSESNPHSN